MNETVKTKDDILRTLDENKEQLRCLGVRRIGLFGSFVRGNQSEKSDVDILIEFESDQKSFDNFMKISFFLEDLLQHRVEIVTMESLSPYIGPHILKEVEYVSVAA